MINKQFVFLSSILAGLAAAPTLAASMEPGWLEVHLLNRQTGQPVADAAVCLGTSARPDQFGARRSDRAGVVRFDEVSPHPLVLTVSGDGYQGRRQALEPLYESRVLVVKLATGGGGPQCDAPQRDAGTASASGLSIDSVHISADPASRAGGVLVQTRISGSANQIRVSEAPDFGGSKWRTYKPAVPFAPSAGEGSRHLYIQVRRLAQVEGASIEVVSPVKTVIYRPH